MILTVFDPRTGERVRMHFNDLPREMQAKPAQVVPLRRPERPVRAARPQAH